MGNGPGQGLLIIADIDFRPRSSRKRCGFIIVFTLSFRDVDDRLAGRGVTVSYEIVRQWCLTFGLDYARRIKKSQGHRGDRWYLDELVGSIRGQRRYLWRAVDQDGDLVEIFVQNVKILRPQGDSFARPRLPKGKCRLQSQPISFGVTPPQNAN